MTFNLFDSPELLDIQRTGFYSFLKQGIPQLLANEFPIKVKNGNYSIELLLNEQDIKLINPENDPRDCILKMKTYSCKLYARVKIVCKESSSKIIYQGKPEWVFLGQLPMMTKRGHFIINGSPRVIVNQVVRAPGIYFQKLSKKDEKNRARFYGDIIPLKGVWVRLQMTKKGRIEAKFKKGKKVEAAFLQKCLQIVEEQSCFSLNLSNTYLQMLKFFQTSLRRASTNSQSDLSFRASTCACKYKASLCKKICVPVPLLPPVRLQIEDLHAQPPSSSPSPSPSPAGKGKGKGLRMQIEDLRPCPNPLKGVRASRRAQPYLSLTPKVASTGGLPIPILYGLRMQIEDLQAHGHGEGTALTKRSFVEEGDRREKNSEKEVFVYDNYSKLLDKRKSRAESKAEYDAFIHTYDKLYRTAQDKELEEWQKKKKNLKFFRGALKLPCRAVSSRSPLGGVGERNYKATLCKKIGTEGEEGEKGATVCKSKNYNGDNNVPLTKDFSPISRPTCCSYSNGSSNLSNCQFAAGFLKTNLAVSESQEIKRTNGFSKETGLTANGLNLLKDEDPSFCFSKENKRFREKRIGCTKCISFSQGEASKFRYARPRKRIKQQGLASIDSFLGDEKPLGGWEKVALFFSQENEFKRKKCSENLFATFKIKSRYDLGILGREKINNKFGCTSCKAETLPLLGKKNRVRYFSRQNTGRATVVPLLPSACPCRANLRFATRRGSACKYKASLCKKICMRNLHPLRVALANRRFACAWGSPCRPHPLRVARSAWGSPCPCPVGARARARAPLWGRDALASTKLSFVRRFAVHANLLTKRSFVLATPTREEKHGNTFVRTKERFVSRCEPVEPEGDRRETLGVSNLEALLIQGVNKSSFAEQNNSLSCLLSPLNSKALSCVKSSTRVYNQKNRKLCFLKKDKKDKQSRFTKSCNTQLTSLDLCSASVWLHRLRKGELNSDDIDHSQNRRVRTSGELLQTQFSQGVDRLKNIVSTKLQEKRSGAFFTPKGVKKPVDFFEKAKPQRSLLLENAASTLLSNLSAGRGKTKISFASIKARHQPQALLLKQEQNSYKLSVKELFSTKPITGALREFFGSNPLSQYMDQTNPLAEITHKRRISSLGIGGISRESAGMAIRGIHPTHYGRICPIETPEGKNAGLVNSLAFYTQVDLNGFLKTPYYRVFKGQIQSSLGFSFCSAKEESRTSLQIAPSDLQKSWNNVLRTRLSTLESVPVRVADTLLDVFKKENPYRVQLIAISPIQMISVATSLIPFLEHNDANRALMGSNMQRQAVPLMISERPIVGTGLESNVIVESGHITESQIAGFASHITADRVVIDRLEKNLQQKTSFLSFRKDRRFCQSRSFRFCYTGDSVVRLQVQSFALSEDLHAEPKGELLTPKLGFLEKRKKSLEKASKKQSKALTKRLTKRSFVLVPNRRFGCALASTKRSFVRRFAYPSCPTPFPCPIGASRGTRLQIEDLHAQSFRARARAPASPYGGRQGQGQEGDGGCACKSSYKAKLCTCKRTGVGKARVSAVEFSFLGKARDQQNVDLKKKQDLGKSTKKQSYLKSSVHPLTIFSRSNQNTCITEKPLIQEFDWVQKGDVLTDCSASHNGELAVGKNVLVAYIPWEGYNFEDAIVISDRLVREHVYTSLHIERYVFQAQEIKDGNEWFTKDIPGIEPGLTQHLEESGLPKIGSFLKEGDLLVGKIRYLNKKPSTPYERLLCDILGENNFAARNKSFYVPKGVEARVIYHKIINFFDNDPESQRTLSALGTSIAGTNKIYKSNEQILGSRLCKSSRQSSFCPKGTQPSASPNTLKGVQERVEEIFLHKSKDLPILPKVLRSKIWKHTFLERSFLPVLACIAKQKTVSLQCVPCFTESNARLCTKQNQKASASTKLRVVRRFAHGLHGTEKDIVLQNASANLLCKSKICATSHFCRPVPFSKKRGFEAVANKISLGGSQVSPLKKSTSPSRANLRFATPSCPCPYGARARDALASTKLRFVRKFACAILPCPCPVGARARRGRGRGRQVAGEAQNSKARLKAAKTVHLFLGEKRVIQIGDKISGRHGNKGVISTILPRQDMPYLPDGTPIDIILNPLGVPSRMNVGQVLECLLGLASHYLNQHFKIEAFDERYGVEASKSIVFLKLYQARLQSGQNWLFQVNFPGKTRLIDGRSGECFDQWITVGKAYILKLIHMVSEKIHARSTGPYALITQQPLRGRSNKGGQRLGEMEVWAFEGFGAAYTLQELLTKKSDDFFGRKQIVDSILPNPSSVIDVLKPNSRIDQSSSVLGHPEIFKVLLCELQALCLDLGVYVLTPESFQRSFLGVIH